MKTIITDEKNTMTILENTANPAPLGLLGFGLTTILLNIHNIGVIGFSSMILAMGIFVGGIAQVIAGILEFKKNNTFGMTAFIAYGFFWISLVALIIMPLKGLGTKPNNVEMAAYLLVWGIFSSGMLVGTFRISKALQIVFGLLVVLFFGLAIADYMESESIKIFAGYIGILCGLSALYSSLAQILNEVYGKQILPLGVVTIKK